MHRYQVAMVGFLIVIQLCNNDIDAKLFFDVYDWERVGSDELMASAETTLRELQTNRCVLISCNTTYSANIIANNSNPYSTLLTFNSQVKLTGKKGDAGSIVVDTCDITLA